MYMCVYVYMYVYVYVYDHTHDSVRIHIVCVYVHVYSLSERHAVPLVTMSDCTTVVNSTCLSRMQAAAR